MTTEWKPPEGFNILDYRDFKNFPQYDTPPYVLKFRFPDIHGSVVFYGVSADLMGWNLPGCKTDTLFSRVCISKNGFEDVYYDKPMGKVGVGYDMIMDLDKDMTMTADDVVYISMFPLCPAHMVDVGRVGFLSTTTTDGTDATPKPQKQPSTPSSATLDHYWYIYITLFVMVVLLMLSLLFMTMRPQPKYRLVYHDK